MVYHFPGPEARDKLDTAIQLYAQGKWHRQRMMTFIAMVLEGYKVTRLAVRNYTVRRVEPVELDFPYPVVLIEADREVHKACPACRSDDWRYLAGEAPVAKAWCMSCGCIYRRGVRSDEEISKGGNGNTWAVGGITLNCKICSPPSTAICPKCEAEIQAQVRRLVDRVGLKLDRMRREVRNCSVVEKSRVHTSQVTRYCVGGGGGIPAGR